MHDMTVTEELQQVEARLKAIAIEERELKAKLAASKSNAGPELWTMKQAAEYLSIPEPTAYYLAQRDKLAGSFKIGGRWRVRAADIRAMAEAPVAA